MPETKQSKWGSFLCWLAGHHIGNVQWGEYDKDDVERRKIIHKCSCCFRPVTDKSEQKKDQKCGYEKIVDDLFDTHSKMVIGNTIPDSPCTKNGKPFKHE